MKLFKLENDMYISVCSKCGSNRLYFHQDGQIHRVHCCPDCGHPVDWVSWFLTIQY